MRRPRARHRAQETPGGPPDPALATLVAELLDRALKAPDPRPLIEAARALLVEAPATEATDTPSAPDAAAG
ncbi:MAG: hypothetical protein HY720_18000 [Planctomycetes bacterium]|nr:hypothetical protein [Planctomycetota bacterium]